MMGKLDMIITGQTSIYLFLSENGYQMEIRQIVQDVKKKIIQLRISLLSTLRNIKYLTNHTVLKVNYQLPLEQNSIWLRPVLMYFVAVQ